LTILLPGSEVSGRMVIFTEFGVAVAAVKVTVNRLTELGSIDKNGDGSPVCEVKRNVLFGVTHQAVLTAFGDLCHRCPGGQKHSQRGD